VGIGGNGGKGDCGGLQAVGPRYQLKLAGGFCLDDDLGEAIEEAPRAALVGLVATGVPVADANDCPAGDLELDSVLGGRDFAALVIDAGDSEEGDVLAICVQAGAIRGEDETRGGAGGLYEGGFGDFAVFEAVGLEAPGLVRDLPFEVGKTGHVFLPRLWPLR